MLIVGVRKLQKKGEGVCLHVPVIWLRNANISVNDRVSVAIDEKCRLIITSSTAKHSQRR